MPFTKSLRAKVLVWALIPITLSLVVVAIIALFAYERAARDVVLKRDAELADVSAARLAEGLDRLSLLLQTIANDDDIQSLEAVRMQRALEREQNQLFVFNAGVVIYDDQGIAVGSDPFAFQRRGLRFPVPSEFDDVMTTLMPSFSNVFRDEISGEDVVLLTVPIVTRGPEFKGAATGMSTLNSLLLNTSYSEVLEITEGSERFAYLVDGDGQVIFHRDRSRLGSDLSAIAAVRRVTEGETGSVVTEGPEGVTVISGFAPVPDTNWAVITQEEWQSVVGPIRVFSRVLLGLLVMGGVFSATLIFFAVGRILKPIKDLTRGAERIAGGDFEHNIITKSNDEIHDLATQFNSMAGALQASYTDLESRIEERTQELQESEFRYRGLFDDSRDAIFVSSAEGKITDCNQAALELFGFTKSAALGSDISERFIDPADREQFREEIAKNGSLTDFEVQLTKHDGTPIFCLLTATRRHEKDGSNLGIQGTVRDITERKQAEQELNQQTRDLAVLGERNRMAREIHDTLAQGFTGIVLQLEAAEQALEQSPAQVPDRLSRAKSQARESLQEARRSVWDLVPRALEDGALDTALQDEAERYTEFGREHASFQLTGPRRELSTEVQATLLRICQESLTNTRKHAQATNIAIVLAYLPNAVSLSIQDDGVGFNTDEVGAQTRDGGFGLGGMEQRVTILGGTFAVTSEQGLGTTVEVHVPTP